MGLIPAGGGCMEMAARASARAPDDPAFDLLPLLRGPFEAIGLAKVSTSAEEARDLGYLRPGDTRLDGARDADRRRQADRAGPGPGRLPPAPAPPHPGGGRERRRRPCRRRSATWSHAHQVSEHDARWWARLARVLSGGDVPPGAQVSEQHLLDLEREAFLSLCGEEKTPRAHPAHASRPANPCGTEGRDNHARRRHSVRGSHPDRARPQGQPAQHPPRRPRARWW